MRRRVDKERVRRNFGAGAAAYEAATPVQAAMALRLLDLVRRRLPRPQRLLELGCGPGRLTAALCAAFPEADILACDLAPEMLAEARRRLPADGRLRLLLADAEYLSLALPPEARFDLVLSNATVQWFDEPVGGAARYLDRLVPGGLLALATFGPETFRELRESFAVAERELGLPPGQYLLPLPPPAAWQAGFARSRGLELHVETACQSFPGVRQFLAALQACGAGARGPAAAGRLGKALFLAMARHYLERFPAPGGGIVVTYQPLYLLAAPGPLA